MSTADELATAIADAKSDAQALRRNGHLSEADNLERIASSISAKAEPFTEWLSEEDAILRSGYSDRGIRRRFKVLLECGLARLAARGRREYLMCAVPKRANVAQAYSAGLSGEEAA